MTLPLRFAVLGDPIAHSKSPSMHESAYRALGLPHVYEAVRATASDLPQLVQDLRDGRFAGLNVTVPHKRRILDHVDEVDPSASRVFASNTLVLTPAGRVRAYNTDVPALADELRRLAPENDAEAWRAGAAIVLGTGGAARSAICALVGELGTTDITVRGRSLSTPEGRRAFLTDLAPEVVQGATLSLEPLETPRAAERAAELRAIAVVQATSAGMTGADGGACVADAVRFADLPARAVALDVVYAPPKTPFLAAADAVAIRSANGFGMLARQGALAFELWLKIPAPYNAMLTALV